MSQQKRARPLGRFGLVLGTVLLLAGCGMFKSQSQQEALADMQWDYGSEAIKLHIASESDLNWWGGQPHTLLMAVVQMEELSAMEAYKNSAQALSHLLLSETAPNGLLTLNKFFIEPSSTRNIALARVDKSRYVAVIFGYQHLDPKRIVRLYQIGVDMTHKGWAFKEYQAAPEPLLIKLRLGADSVLSSDQLTPEPTLLTQPRSGPIDLVDQE